MTESGGYHRMGGGGHTFGGFLLQRAQRMSCFLMLLSLCVFGLVFYLYLSSSTELAVVKQQEHQLSTQLGRLKTELLETKVREERVQQELNDCTQKGREKDSEIEQLRSAKTAAAGAQAEAAANAREKALGLEQQLKRVQQELTETQAKLTECSKSALNATNKEAIHVPTTEEEAKKNSQGLGGEGAAAATPFPTDNLTNGTAATPSKDTPNNTGKGKGGEKGEKQQQLNGGERSEKDEKAEGPGVEKGGADDEHQEQEHAVVPAPKIDGLLDHPKKDGVLEGEKQKKDLKGGEKVDVENGAPAPAGEDFEDTAPGEKAVEKKPFHQLRGNKEKKEKERKLNGGEKEESDKEKDKEKVEKEEDGAVVFHRPPVVDAEHQLQPPVDGGEAAAAAFQRKPGGRVALEERMLKNQEKEDKEGGGGGGELLHAAAGKGKGRDVGAGDLLNGAAPHDED